MDNKLASVPMERKAQRIAREYFRDAFQNNYLSEEASINKWKSVILDCVRYTVQCMKEVDSSHNTDGKIRA